MLFPGCLNVTWHWMWSAILNSNIKITQSFELYEHNTITKRSFKQLKELRITAQSVGHHTKVSKNNRNLPYIELQSLFRQIIKYQVFCMISL